MIVGAKVKDEISGKEFAVKAKCIINATGPFTDEIRKMDDHKIPRICCPSSGVHIVLPGYYRCVIVETIHRLIIGIFIFSNTWIPFSLHGHKIK